MLHPIDPTAGFTASYRRKGAAIVTGAVSEYDRFGVGQAAVTTVDMHG